jgi:hypothetical protein
MTSEQTVTNVHPTVMLERRIDELLKEIAALKARIHALELKVVGITDRETDDHEWLDLSRANPVDQKQ